MTVPLPFPILLTVRPKVFRVKVAVTDLAASIVTVQVPVPVQVPDQPVKSESDVGAAERVTMVPTAKVAVQLAPQLIPAGDDVTVPLPLPVLATPNEKVLVKVAVTDLPAFMVTVQVTPLALSHPAHAVKIESAAGVAVRVTTVPVTKAPEQVTPQSIPAGEEVTVPAPLPDLFAVKTKLWRLKVPVTDFAALIETVQVVPETLSHPDQPAKMELTPGVGVRVTVAPKVKLAEQVVPQLIPAGEEVTVPVPVPDFVTDRVTGGW